MTDFEALNGLPPLTIIGRINYLRSNFSCKKIPIIVSFQFFRFYASFQKCFEKYQ